LSNWDLKSSRRISGGAVTSPLLPLIIRDFSRLIFEFLLFSFFFLFLLSLGFDLFFIKELKVYLLQVGKSMVLANGFK
jgi:hypothetical protein